MIYFGAPGGIRTPGLEVRSWIPLKKTYIMYRAIFKGYSVQVLMRKRLKKIEKFKIIYYGLKKFEKVYYKTNFGGIWGHEKLPLGELFGGMRKH